MKDLIIQFLQANADLSKPILLGVSGGPDSLLLLHLMLECRYHLPVRFGIAHIDHAWRAESAEEAAQLKSLAGQLDIPFHLKVLDSQLFKGNLEAHCRHERIAFFTDICRKYGYQAVVLGHHADDLTETVLKRLFEGASLIHLGGMREVVHLDGLCIWRPLLQITKKQILQLADALPFKPFDDRTNLDPRFMRGRFRSSIIPLLSQAFGKEISKPLRKLSAESQELKSYFDQRISTLMEMVETSPLGAFLDVGLSRHFHPLELKFAIKSFCAKVGFCLPEAASKKAVGLILEHKADKFFEADGGTLYIDRGRLFATLVPPKMETWRMTAQKVKFHGQPNISGWQNVWRGHVEVFLPLGEYELKASVLHKPYPRSSPLSKLWTDAKAPAFLRHCTPVVWKEGVVAFEFLSGRTLHKIDKGQDALCIALTIC